MPRRGRWWSSSTASEMPRGGIGGLVRWDGASAAADASAERLLGPIRHRARGGWRWEARGATAIGSARLVAAAAAPAAPLWSRDGELAVAADARLFNAEALARRLAPRPRSTSALLGAAYRRWGAEMVEHLDGEFAFALWDGGARRLLLARDPFGARPLFYRLEPRRSVFASEPKQILALPDVAAEPDPLLVGEYLLGRFEELDHTFLAGVRRLRPGHLLVVEGGRGEPRPWWRPAPAAAARTGPGTLAAFRAALAEAVGRRLDPDVPATAHLSGGLDSAAIVLSAARLAAERGGAGPPLTIVSCRFPGLDCDETRYIEALARVTPFAHRFVEPLAIDPLAGLEDELWRLDAPFADLARGQFLALSAAVRAAGACTVLTGLGGDEVVMEEGYLQELAVRRRWGRLLLEAAQASRYTRDGLAYLLRDAMRPVAPGWTRRLYRRLRRRRGWRPPAWATPELVAFFAACPEPPPSAGGQGSRIHDAVLRNVQHPEVCWALEALECRAAEQGYLPSHPFLDRALVELVLSIPFEQRIPRGRWKHLVRGGLADELPAAVRERREKTVFDSFDRLLVAREWRRIRDRLFDGGEWRAAPWVGRRAAEELCERCRPPREPGPQLRHELWRVTTFELWLRQLGRYNRQEEGARDPGAREPAIAAAAKA